MGHIFWVFLKYTFMAISPLSIYSNWCNPKGRFWGGREQMYVFTAVHCVYRYMIYCSNYTWECACVCVCVCVFVCVCVSVCVCVLCHRKQIGSRDLRLLPAKRNSGRANAFHSQCKLWIGWNERDDQTNITASCHPTQNLKNPLATSSHYYWWFKKSSTTW